MNYDELLAETVRKCARDRVKGEVASYIPELKKGDPSLVGVALRTSGGLYECGD
ncbi:MAG TPA: glutaminase, partial [Natronincola sp.]|nr:glutaminase [Natronincola sp.]